MYECLQRLEEVPNDSLSKFFNSFSSTLDWIRLHDLPLLYAKEIYELASNRIITYEQKKLIENDETKITEYMIGKGSRQDVINIINVYFQNSHYFGPDFNAILIEPDKAEFLKIQNEYTRMPTSSTVKDMILQMCFVMDEMYSENRNRMRKIDYTGEFRQIDHIDVMIYKRCLGFKIACRYY